MTTFLLIRHASVDALGKWLAGRAPGSPLNPQGTVEAQQLAARLNKVPISAIYSSPIERALQTAAPLCHQRNLDVQIRDDFNEIDFGDWTGKSFEELEPLAAWVRFNRSRSSARPPRGESMLEVSDRMVDGLEDLRERHGDACIAVISHGDPIRAVIAHYAGLHLDFFQRIAVDPASVSILHLQESGAQLLRLNDTGSFAGLAGCAGLHPK